MGQAPPMWLEDRFRSGTRADDGDEQERALGDSPTHLGQGFRGGTIFASTRRGPLPSRTVRGHS